MCPGMIVAVMEMPHMAKGLLTRFRRTDGPQSVLKTIVTNAKQRVVTVNNIPGQTA